MLSFLAIFVPIFVIIDSPGVISVFIALTEGLSKKERKQIINTAVVIASIVLLCFAFFGNFIFGYLNISLPAFEIAGGFLLFLIAIDMLFARKSRTVYSEEQEKEAKEKENIAIFPLAIPLLTGPGAITTVMVLMNTSETLTEKIMVVFSIILTFIITKIVLDKSINIKKYLGTTGLQVITRIMGILVAAISVQFIMNGIMAAIK